MTTRMAPKATVDLDELRTKIRAADLRVTAPRVAVLRCLVEAASPQSHGELAERLAPEGWDRATIYRNLTDLTEAGLARRTDLGDHVWRFELVSSGAAHSAGSHPHFLCNECGDVVCLPDEAVQVSAAKGTPRALRKKGFEVQIRGRCDRCT